MIRLLARLLCLFVALILFLGIGLYYSNNRSGPKPTEDELKASLEQSVQWVLTNRDHVLSQNNSILWWMLGESARVTGDARLEKIVADYVEALPAFSPWQYFFNPNSLAPIRDEMLLQLPDYNILFLYGLTCSKELAQLETVQEQLKSNFCSDNHPISPACVTHQLMGVRFMQRRDCGDKEANAVLVSQLQHTIESQLTWDPRAVDVYIQRVLMLTDSGAQDRIKTIWLRKVLEAQNDDGGWDGFEPLIPLGKGRSFGFGAKFFTIKSPKSNLHATAQGVLLLSLMTAP